MNNIIDWKPFTSSVTVHHKHCSNAVDTPGEERRSISITVTAPKAVRGEA